MKLRLIGFWPLGKYGYIMHFHSLTGEFPAINDMITGRNSMWQITGQEAFIIPQKETIGYNSEHYRSFVVKAYEKGMPELDEIFTKI